jgi:hypothetical protein
MLNAHKTQHKTFMKTTLAGYHVSYSKSRGRTKNVKVFAIRDFPVRTDVDKQDKYHRLNQR